MIDWNKAQQLAGEVGSDRFEEVAVLSLQAIEIALQTIGMAEDLEAALHFVKRCALNLGFAAFATRVAEAEHLAALGRPDEVDLIGLGRVYRESRDLFLTEFRGRIAA
ncbi:Hpt domain protein [Pseudooceanicola batsensis HTCC2597]|uniref:Hpt domain protein n=1 Tax=Pseudooceanicola batsensis (strain ATCC BAA-863 / DSM 15984 / KCTC 12145 / HTCC2597) TaxID=252305 RepID=A3TWN9_PSEBH|nr:Hpt domain protein [Pseudooceanicola batsensis]EAQ04035.1 Hpt domain protein [Pseudooceanicola batsensis HTCC2597]